MNTIKRKLLVAGASAATLTLFTACTTTGSDASADPAATRRSLDSASDAALSRLYTQQPGSKELIARARGVLVFPAFGSAGFIVGGGAGNGVLREAGRTTGYYRMTEASVGFLAGAQSQALFILFMTDDALKRFRASNGWTVGADANVSLLNVGANAQITSQTAQQDIIGFAMTNSGLMGNLSLNGNRVTKLPL
jgi:lipid-binding SYLF domain-containing protein